jgi:hypothetical protein
MAPSSRFPSFLTVAPATFEAARCPDSVVDPGHFGSLDSLDSRGFGTGAVACRPRSSGSTVRLPSSQHQPLPHRCCPSRHSDCAVLVLRYLEPLRPTRAWTDPPASRTAVRGSAGASGNRTVRRRRRLSLRHPTGCPHPVQSWCFGAGRTIPQRAQRPWCSPLRLHCRLA